MGNELLWWVAVIVALLYVALVERRPFSSIGFRRPGIADLVIAVVAGVVSIVGLVAIYALVFPLLHLQVNIAVVNRIMSTPFWYRFFLVTRAAVAEEVLFRGYPMERIREWTGSRWIGAVVSCAAFTYAHLGSWGAAQLIVAGFGGVLLSALYLWRRNLYANMLAHWVADGIGFLIPH